GHIDRPTDGGCVILSVGRDKFGDRFEPGLGMQARSFFSNYREGPAAASYHDVPNLPQGRMFRMHLDGKPTPIFLLAARELGDQLDDDARSLAAIAEATAQALTVVEKTGFARVSMGLMAAGPERTDEPPYCLIAQLSGIRVFAEGSAMMHPGLRSISID